MSPRLIVVLLACVVSTPGASAQIDRFPQLWSPDLRVEGMALLGDTLFATGLFTRVGPSTGQLAVLDKTTGEADTSLPPFDALGLGSRNITDIVPDGQGGYYVGGEFRFVAEQPRRNLAHVLPDGTLDPLFQPGTGVANTTDFFGYVTTLALDRDAASPSGAGVLYVGGRFDTIGGQARQNLAALDAVTGEVLPLQATFAYPSTTAYTPFVETLLVHEGVLYVGGIFEQVSGQPHTGLVALDIVTGAVLSWRADLADENPNFFAFPDALALGDGTLYLGGGFDFVNGQRRLGPAEVTLADPTTGEGGTPTSWAPAPPGFNNFSAFDLVVIEGSIYAAAGTALTRINRVTAAVTYLTGGLSSASALAYEPKGGPSSQGVLYVGGEGTRPGSTTRVPAVVGVDAATGQPTGYRVDGASPGSIVTALAVEPGPAGRLFAGGGFTTLSAGVVRRQGLAAFDLTTGRPTDFFEGISGVGQGLFEDLALSPDGRFLYGYSNIVGGAALDLTEFDLVTGATRQFIPQGLTAATYGASAHVTEARERPARRAEARTPVTRTAPNPRVENAGSGVVVTDTRVCVGLSGVACYDRTTTDLLFYTPMVYVSGGGGEDNGNLLYLPPTGPVAGPGGADGTLFLAAPVEEAPPGTRRPALVALDVATGSVIPDWTPGFAFAGAEGYALALLDPDGTDGPLPASLYAGGSRDWTVQGQSRDALAAFDPQTAALGPWAARVSGGTAPVLAMASHRTTDGRGVVYAGGTLFFSNDVRVQSAAVAFDAVTGADLEWARTSNGIPRVLLVSERLGAVFVGGVVGLDGTGHSNLLALTPARPILPTAGEGGPEAPVVRASVSLAGPNPFRNRTALSVSLPEAQAVEASLYDVLGRRVAVLHDGALPAGVSRLDVDASTLPAGVYVVRVSGAGFTEARTLTVVR